MRGVQAALSAYGDSAQVARVPESGACRYCEELFTEGGAPKVFSVAEPPRCRRERRAHSLAVAGYVVAHAPKLSV